MSLCAANRLYESHPFFVFLYQEHLELSHGFNLCSRRAFLLLICAFPEASHDPLGLLACFRQFSFTNQLRVFGVYLLTLEDLRPIGEKLHQRIMAAAVAYPKYRSNFPSTAFLEEDAGKEFYSCFLHIGHNLEKLLYLLP
jgi:hypothetical protein